MHPGFCLGRLNGEQKWVDTVLELMKAVDDYIKLPVRDNEKPFLMSVEDVFTITGRGTLLQAVLRQVSSIRVIELTSWV